MTARTGRTRLRWGGATDVGRVRSNNQDQYVARDDVGLWAVADGMGGHRGGEVASEIACETLARSFDQHTIEGLVDAIERANSAVYRAGTDDPELTGMGTTVVALAVVGDDAAELLAIANVGDSRGYRWSAGELDQLTTDHSLVADLVREGSLSPDEAAIHPQRNILTRVLGVYDDVPVDAFTVEPRHGDRYVLCSDGLFNEVPEHAIAAVLRRLADPADAADELVRQALEGGGRDNITVVVVDVVDDGGRAAAASSALAGEPTRAASAVPARSPAYADLDDYGAAGRRGRDPRRGQTSEPEDDDYVDFDEYDDDIDDDLDDDEDGDLAAPSGRRARHAARPRRRLTWRVLLFTLVVLALVAGAVATIQWYATSTYFVGFEGSRVAIFKGRPGGLLWIDPELVETTSLARDRVPAARRHDIENGMEQSSLADARRYVDNVTELADELDPPTTSTTATTATTTATTLAPPVTAAPASPPAP
ncbi:MAG TPA: Stp1/IreP family PP2C-type Ser/Thr phosphatase [Acidimicrobiales bacterium]|nr:Stp1/IreP family PP2C-type Ser/Thr phosphatase [Acidimicrobiales bacterium]